MKKILFSALACVAFAGSAFASNEIVEFKTTTDSELSGHYETLEMLPLADYPCKFLIYVYNPVTEEFIDSLIYYGNESADDCFNEGLRVQEEYSIKYEGANVSMDIIK